MNKRMLKAALAMAADAADQATEAECLELYESVSAFTRRALHPDLGISEDEESNEKEARDSPPPSPSPSEDATPSRLPLVATGVAAARLQRVHKRHADPPPLDAQPEQKRAKAAFYSYLGETPLTTLELEHIDCTRCRECGAEVLPKCRLDLGYCIECWFRRNGLLPQHKAFMSYSKGKRCPFHPNRRMQHNVLCCPGVPYVCFSWNVACAFCLVCSTCQRRVIVSNNDEDRGCYFEVPGEDGIVKVRCWDCLKETDFAEFVARCNECKSPDALFGPLFLIGADTVEKHKALCRSCVEKQAVRVEPEVIEIVE